MSSILYGHELSDGVRMRVLRTGMICRIFWKGCKKWNRIAFNRRPDFHRHGLGVNFAMYGIARGATKSSGKSLIEMLGKSLNTSTRPKDNSMDELHRKVEELEKEER